MRNVLSWSSDRFSRHLSGIRASHRRFCADLPAGLAVFTSADRGGHIPIPMLTGGLHDDEGGCLEKPQIPARHSLPAVSYELRERQRPKKPLLFSYSEKDGHIVIQEQQ